MCAAKVEHDDLLIGLEAVASADGIARRARHAHDERHVLDAPEGGHRREARHPQQQVCLGVRLRDLLTHGAESHALRLDVLGVDVVPREVGHRDAAHPGPRGRRARHRRNVDHHQVCLDLAQVGGLGLDDLLLPLEDGLEVQQTLHAVDGQRIALDGEAVDERVAKDQPLRAVDRLQPDGARSLTHDVNAVARRDEVARDLDDARR